MFHKSFICLLLLAGIFRANAQQRLGINTSSPVRHLEVYGAGSQHLRIHSTSNASGASGIEFIRGLNGPGARDWRIMNDPPVLRIQSSDDNFTSGALEALRVNSSFHTGIGTISPAAPLHVDQGALIAFGGNGYLKIGPQNGQNLTFDNTQLVALQSGVPAQLYLQPHGGLTNFCSSGGNVYMGLNGGRVSVGTGVSQNPLTIEDEDFQLCIRNAVSGTNDWFIGATNNSWVAGDDQLVFSPASGSSNAVLRLKNQNENDGEYAPVMIHSTENHTLLFDGNEIDTRGTPLYINHNTDENTYINPTGGRVGIGTTSPNAMLHVAVASGDNLSLHSSGTTWRINALSGGTQNLGFYYDNFSDPFGFVHGVSGNWLHLSDSTAKTNITPLGEVSGLLDMLQVYTYSFRHDTTHTTYTGILAQEAEALFPQMVYQADGQYGVDYAQLAVIGLKALQEQENMIRQLRTKIAKIKTLAQGPVQDSTPMVPVSVR